MKEAEKLAFQELIFQAVQAGKQETSGLVASLKKEILIAVADQVKITVNGKIDKQTEHLKEQDKKLEEIHQEQIRVKDEVAKLKTETTPATKTTQFIMSAGKVVMWISIATASVGGAIITISKLW